MAFSLSLTFLFHLEHNSSHPKRSPTKKLVAPAEAAAATFAATFRLVGCCFLSFKSGRSLQLFFFLFTSIDFLNASLSLKQRGTLHRECLMSWLVAFWN